MAGLVPAIHVCASDRQQACFPDGVPIFGTSCFRLAANLLSSSPVIVTGTNLVQAYFAKRKGDRGIKAAQAQYEAWLAIARAARWTVPEAVKRSHPKASILKGSRLAFNIKGNDYRLVAALSYGAGVVAIRFFGTHAEYDEIDAETV